MNNIEKEWGELTKRGWKSLPTIFEKNCAKLGISASQAWFITIMHGFTTGNNPIYPKIGVIAKRMCMSERAIKYHIKTLKEMGLMIVRQRNCQQEYDFSPMYAKLIKLEDENNSQPPGVKKTSPPGVKKTSPPGVKKFSQSGEKNFTSRGEKIFPYPNLDQGKIDLFELDILSDPKNPDQDFSSSPQKIGKTKSDKTMSKNKLQKKSKSKRQKKLKSKKTSESKVQQVLDILTDKNSENSKKESIKLHPSKRPELLYWMTKERSDWWAIDILGYWLHRWRKYYGEEDPRFVGHEYSIKKSNIFNVTKGKLSVFSERHLRGNNNLPDYIDWLFDDFLPEADWITEPILFNNVFKFSNNNFFFSRFLQRKIKAPNGKEKMALLSYAHARGSQQKWVKVEGDEVRLGPGISLIKGPMLVKRGTVVEGVKVE